jgi:hypothetical protein
MTSPDRPSAASLRKCWIGNCGSPTRPSARRPRPNPRRREPGATSYGGDRPAWLRTPSSRRRMSKTHRRWLRPRYETVTFAATDEERGDCRAGAPRLEDRKSLNALPGRKPTCSLRKRYFFTWGVIATFCDSVATLRVQWGSSRGARDTAPGRKLVRPFDPGSKTSWEGRGEAYLLAATIPPPRLITCGPISTGGVHYRVVSMWIRRVRVLVGRPVPATMTGITHRTHQ